MTVPKPRSHNVPYFSRVLPKNMLQTWTGGGGVADSELWPREQAVLTFDFKAHPQ